MARSIDERVVQMQFDNRQFEQNAQTTLGTLGRLKEALNASNVPAKAFDDIGKAASRVDLSGIGTSVDKLSQRFSAMGIVGMTVLQDLTRSALGMAKRLADNTIGQITSGGYARAQKIEDARFTLQGLLKDEKEVEAVMKNVDGAVSGTAYSYDAAASVAAQFAASGQRAGDQMQANLKAVAGVAAMTNSSYEEIGHIFTTVSGQGRLMGQQLNMLSLRGMDAAQIIGDYLGKTGAEVRELVSKGKIDFQTFADAMYDAFGDQAGKANETFTGVMANIRSALSRTGAGFYSPLIAQNSTLVKLLQTVRTLISDTFNKSQFWVRVQEDVTTALLSLFEKTDLWLQSIDFETIIRGFNYIYYGAKSLVDIFVRVGDSIREYFGESFFGPSANEFLMWTRSVNYALNQFVASIDEVDISEFANAIMGYFVYPIGIVIELFKDLWEITKPVRTFLAEVAKLFIVVGDLLGSIFYDVLWDVRNAGNVFSGFGEVISDIFGRLTETVINWQEMIREWGPEIKEALYKPEILAGLNAFAVAIKNIVVSFQPFEKIKSAVTKVTEFITTYLGKAKESVIAFWNSFKDGDGASDGAEQFESRFERFKGVLTNILKIFKWAGGYIWNLIKPFTAAIASIFKSMTFEDVKNLGLIGVVTLLGGQFQNLLVTVSQAAAAFRDLGQGGLLHGIFGNWKPVVTGFSNTLFKAKEALTQFSADIKAGILLKIAAAVAILAASLIALSFVPVDRMANALVTMAGLGAILAGTIAALQQVAKLTSMKNTAELVVTAMTISIALGILAGAVKKMGSLSNNELGRGILGLVFSMASLSSAMIAMSKLAPQMSKGMGAVLLMAISMSLIAGAVKKMAKMDFDSLMSAVLALTMATGPLIVLTILADSADDRALLAVTAMIFGVVGLIKSIGKVAKSVDDTALLKVGGVMSLLVGIMGAIVLGMGYLSGKMKFNYVAMGMMIGSMVSLATSIAMIAPALAALALFDIDRVIGAAVGIAIAVGSIAVAAKAMGSGVAGAASMMAFVIAINLLVPPLIALGVAAKPAVIGMAIIAAGLFGLAQAGTALTAALPGLLGLGASLLLVGGAVALFGFGVMQLSLAFVMFAGSAAAGAAGITLIVTTIVKLVPMAVSAVTFALTALVVAIVRLAPIVVRGIAEGIMSLIETLTQHAPALFTAAVLFLTAMVNAIRSVIPLIAQTVVELLVTIVQVLVTYAPVIAQALFDLTIGLINTTANVIRNNYHALFDAVKNLLLAILEMALSIIQEFLDMIPGIGSTIAGILDKPKEYLREQAESGDAEQAGSQMANGVANGINSSNAPEQAGAGIMDKITAGFNSLTGGEGMATNFMSSFTGGIEGFDMSSIGGTMYTNVSEGFANPEGAYNLGNTFGTDINTGVTDAAEESKSAGESLSLNVIEGAKNEEGFTEAGKTNVQSYIGGMEAESENVITAGNQVAQQGLNAADKKEEWNGLGKSAASGFAKGIDANNYLATNAGRKLGNAAYKAAQKALDSHSPSRKFAELGRFSAIGYSDGVEKFAYLASDATTNMGDAALHALSSAMTDIDRVLDYEPTITPVLDLSSVQNGTANIGNMFDRNSMLAAQAGYSFDANMQSETESLLRSLAAQSDVLVSIRELLASQELRLDSGELVGGIAARMDSALGTRAIRAGRGNHA